MENDNDIKLSTDAFEKSLENEVDSDNYVLRLFVSGMTPNSLKAIENIKNVCQKNLKGRYTLEIIDIYQQPELAKSEQIIAAPTLLRKLPVPLRKFIGDLSDSERILIGLNLLPNASKDPASR
ncbi:MAG: circadian clock KaiB family protein [Desulfobacterales bacterium]